MEEIRNYKKKMARDCRTRRIEQIETHIIPRTIGLFEVLFGSHWRSVMII